VNPPKHATPSLLVALPLSLFTLPVAFFGSDVSQQLSIDARITILTCLFVYSVGFSAFQIFKGYNFS
jgi:hypothetical protein